MSEVTLEHFWSSTIGAIAKALAGAQSQMTGAKRTAQNPHLKSRYATLEDALDAVALPLNTHGIAYVQLPFAAGPGFVGVSTMLVHESGEHIGSKVTMPVAKQDAQGHGSAYTYLRRYSLMMVCGIAPTDDDGEEAVKPAAPVAVKAAPTKKVESDATEASIREAINAAKNPQELAAAAARVTKESVSSAARDRLRADYAAAVQKLSGAAA